MFGPTILKCISVQFITGFLMIPWLPVRTTEEESFRKAEENPRKKPSWPLAKCWTIPAVLGSIAISASIQHWLSKANVVGSFWTKVKFEIREPRGQLNLKKASNPGSIPSAPRALRSYRRSRMFKQCVTPSVCTCTCKDSKNKHNTECLHNSSNYREKN